MLSPVLCLFFVFFVTLLLQPTPSACWQPRFGRSSYPHHRFFLPNPCILHDERTGANFDLTSLRKMGNNNDYIAHDKDYLYRMNICGPVNAGGPCGNSLICQYNAKTNAFVAKIAVYDGYFGPRLTLLDASDPGAGVQAHYMNGDICYLGKEKKRATRNTVIQYKCAADTTDRFEVHEDENTCTFTVTVETNLACWPLRNQRYYSHGTGFLIFFFLLVFVYLLLGYFDNRDRGVSGVIFEKHREFWYVTLPDLVKEGCTYSYNKINEWRKIAKKDKLLEDNDDDIYHGKGAPTARQDDL